MKCLIETCDQKFSAWKKGTALVNAVENGHLACVKYLIERCGQEISPDGKGSALHSAANGGHLDCVKYLIETCGTEISVRDKEEALKWAEITHRQDCKEYLERVLSPSNPPLTFMHLSEVDRHPCPLSACKNSEEDNVTVKRLNHT